MRTVLFGADKFEYEYLREKEVVRFFKSKPELGKMATIDIETYPRQKYIGHDDAGLLPAKTKIRTLQLCFNDASGALKTYILDFMHEDGSYQLLNPWVVEQLQKMLLSTNLFAHNALFETAHLQNLFVAHYGKFKPLNIRCTMNMYRLLVAAQTPMTKSYPAGLGAVVQMITGVQLPKESQSSDWSAPTLNDAQLDYCALDVIGPHHVVPHLGQDLVDFGMAELFVLNTKAQEALAMMKIYGIDIDKDLHSKLWAEWKQKREEHHKECLGLLNMHLLSITDEELFTALSSKITKAWVPHAEKLFRYAFTTPRKDLPLFLDELRTKLKEEEAVEKDEKGRRRMLRRLIKNIDIMLTSPDSPKQLSDWLRANIDADELKDWPVSEKTNWLQTDSDAFEDHDHLEVVGPIAGYKKYAKLDGTYGEGLSKFFVEQGERTVLYPNYSLCYTHTGRMSSFEPNLQNQPRDDEFRKIYIPSSPDHVLLVADYGQIEIRVAAMLSKEPTMLAAYREGLDIHALTGAAMAKVPLDEVTKEQRQAAKAVNFGLLYGAGAATLKKYSKKAYKVIISDEEAEEYVDTFRHTYPVYRDWQMRQAKAAEGRGYVKTPLGKHRKLFQDNTYTVSMNTPVQGGAAEVMLHAMVNITTALCESDYDAQLVNVVHDEVILNCHKDDKEAVKKIIKDGMEKALLTVFPEATTRDLVEVGEGDNWTEAK